MADTQNKELLTLLADVCILARDHGYDSEEVRTFVQKYTNVPEFVELSAALLYLMQEAGEKSR